MNVKEMRAKDADALTKELQELQKAHFSLRMQKATQQLQNTSQIRRHAARHRAGADRADAEGDRQMNAEKKSLKRTLVGKVVSNKMDKTVTVLVERRVKHPVYGKYVVKSNKYHAHDETDALNEGDIVEIAESRPISKTKTWTVTRVVEAAQAI